MNYLSFVIHKSNNISIKDLIHDINIDDRKWDFIFNFILREANAVYFKGANPNYYNENFEQDINYLSEEIFFDSGQNHFGILFRVKLSSILLSRRHVSKMWNLYESPCLIFLKDRSQEQKLAELFVQRAFFTQIVTEIDGIYILYLGIESDVLWLMSSTDMPWPVWPGSKV